jgi:hypothetical protein
MTFTPDQMTAAAQAVAEMLMPAGSEKITANTWAKATKIASIAATAPQDATALTAHLLGCSTERAHALARAASDSLSGY